MERLKKGYAAIRNGTADVGAKMKDRLATNPIGPGIGNEIMQRLQHSGHQYKIGTRTVEEEKQLSEGGFAFVWRAFDLHSDEVLALKKILCQDKASISMAKREVEVLERLPHHPNLVKYYGHTTEKAGGNAKEVVLLFELCPGGHLLDLLELHQGKLTEAKILSVFREVCTAVNLLHTQSPPIQHRDLKVENILLGSDGSWKLCDFGSWSDEVYNPALMDKQQVSKLTEQIEKYTTMMYRPPEMVDFYQGFEITEAVDVWMLGCILFTLMFCRHPFQDESTLAISNARYDMPNEPTYSEKLQDLTRWCLARNPVDRPDIMEICEILASFESGGALTLPQEVIDHKERKKRLYADDAPTRLPSGLASGTKKDRDRKQKLGSTPRRAESQRSQRSHRPKRNGSNAPWNIDDKVEWPSAIEPTAVPQPTAWCDWEQSEPSASSSTKKSSSKLDRSSSKRRQNEMLSHSWPQSGYSDTWPQTSPSGSTAADDWDPFGNSPGNSPGPQSGAEMSQSWHNASSWPLSISTSREAKANSDRGALEATTQEQKPWYSGVAKGSCGLQQKAAPWSHIEANARHSAPTSSPTWPFGGESESGSQVGKPPPRVLVRANTAPQPSTDAPEWLQQTAETEPKSPTSNCSSRQDSTPQQSRSPWDPLLSANGTAGMTVCEMAGSTQALWASQEDPYSWLTPRPAPKVL